MISAPEVGPPSPLIELTLGDLPSQTEIDRVLSACEIYVWTPDSRHDVSDEAVLVAAGAQP